MMPITSKKTTQKESKTEVITFKVTPREREIIERHAEKVGMAVNQYVRVAVLMDMALEGNIEAIKVVFSSFRDGFKGALVDKLNKLSVELPEYT